MSFSCRNTSSKVPTVSCEEVANMYRLAYRYQVGSSTRCMRSINYYVHWHPKRYSQFSHDLTKQEKLAADIHFLGDLLPPQVVHLHKPFLFYMLIYMMLYSQCGSQEYLQAILWPRSRLFGNTMGALSSQHFQQSLLQLQYPKWKCNHRFWARPCGLPIWQPPSEYFRFWDETSFTVIAQLVNEATLERL